MKQKKKSRNFFRSIFVLPFALAMLIAVFAFDLCLSLYHRIAFAICGMKRVKRKPNFKLDQRKIAMLSRTERFFAIYILYVNGVMNYAKKIIFESEQHFCKPMKMKGGQMVMGEKGSKSMQQMMVMQNMMKNKGKKKK